MICKFLGSGGVRPLPSRSLSALFVKNQGTQLLVDCGEGTQIAAERFNVSLRNVDAVLFTHIHADHVLGIQGLVLTLSNYGRSAPLVIYGPYGIKETIRNALAMITRPMFNVFTVEIKAGNVLKFPGITVTPIRLQHSVPCLGYAFEVVHMPRYDSSRVEVGGLKPNVVAAMQKGYTVEFNNIVLNINRVFGENRFIEKLVYATDTGLCQELIDGCKNADIAVLEGSYGDDSQIPKSSAGSKPVHMTFAQAAQCAKEANVKKLILTHFSPTLVAPDLFLKNARSVFPNTICAIDGMTSGDLGAEERLEDLPIVNVPAQIINEIAVDGKGFVQIPDGYETDTAFYLRAPGLPVLKVQSIKDLISKQANNNSFSEKSRCLKYVKTMQILFDDCLNKQLTADNH